MPRTEETVLAHDLNAGQLVGLITPGSISPHDAIRSATVAAVAATG